MGDAVVLLKEANILLQRADHMLYITYPLIKDNKLIISILENLSNSLIKTMEAVLYYERMYKRIDMFPDSFEVKFDIFKEKCARTYNFDREHVVLIEDLRKIVHERKKSKMEFIRKDKYVICTNNYATKVLTIDKLKEYLNISKIFIKKVNTILKNVR
ncbi:MAG: hypothetical protein ISS82_03960 [Nanoarchaeota archaeon]|nr:hypothetical protein [Nanoarchaeota archaeon]